MHVYAYWLCDRQPVCNTRKAASPQLCVLILICMSPQLYCVLNTSVLLCVLNYIFVRILLYKCPQLYICPQY